MAIEIKKPTLKDIEKITTSKTGEATALYHAHHSLDLYVIEKRWDGDYEFRMIASDIDEDSPDALLCDVEIWDFPENCIIRR